MSVCEACTEQSATRIVVEDNPDEPYRLCLCCEARLLEHELSPRGWYNLASLHGWQNYHLHDDFYDQDGSAYGVNPLPAAPSLSEIDDTPGALFAHAMASWWIEEELLIRFSAIDRVELLEEIERQFARPNIQAKSIALEIAAKVVGELGADFVRTAALEVDRSVALSSWSQAASMCLPIDEGFGATVARLGQMNERERYSQLFSLAYFSGPQVLQWVEDNIPSQNIGSNWGNLVASSLNWETAREWIISGRPLSLATLDALCTIIQSENRTPGKLVGRHWRAASEVEIATTIETYMIQDDAPGVVRKCKFIIKNADVLHRI